MNDIYAFQVGSRGEISLGMPAGAADVMRGKTRSIGGGEMIPFELVIGDDPLKLQ